MKSRIIKRLVGNPRRLLDIGCGWGRDTQHYKNAVGLDLDLVALKEAKQYSDSEFVHGHAEHLPFRYGSFDFVIMVEVIEHLSNPVRAIKEIQRVLEKKGRMILTTPNKGATKGIYKSKDHTYEFTLLELTSLVEKHGLKVLKDTATTIPFIPEGWKPIYLLNFSKLFLKFWRMLDMVFPIKWDIIILVEKR